MDSHHSVTRSPPQICRKIITDAVNQYRSYAAQLHAKKRVLLKLESTAPRSIVQKMTLNVSNVVLNTLPQRAEELCDSFNAIVKTREDELRQVIMQSTEAHIHSLQVLINDLPKTTAERLQDFFMRIHVALVPDDDHDFEDYANNIELPATSQAIVDYRLAIQYLHEVLQRTKYEIITHDIEREWKEEARREAMNAATTMEFDLPQDQLVAQLVKKSISKETAKLNKEINQLRSALNRQVNLKDVKVGSSQRTRKDGGKAGEQPRVSNVKKPIAKAKPKSAKPMPKSKSDKVKTNKPSKRQN